MTTIAISHDNKTLAYTVAALVSKDTDAFVRGTTDKMEDTKKGSLVVMHRLLAEVGAEKLLMLPRVNTPFVEGSNVITDEYKVLVGTANGDELKSFYLWDDFFAATASGKLLHEQRNALREQIKDDNDPSTFSLKQRVDRLSKRITYGKGIYSTAHSCFLVTVGLAGCPKVHVSFDKPDDDYSTKPFFLQDNEDRKLMKALAAPSFAKINMDKAIAAAGGKSEDVTYSQVISTIKRKKKKGAATTEQLKALLKVDTLGKAQISVPNVLEFLDTQDMSQKFVEQIAHKGMTEFRNSLYSLRDHLDILLEKPEIAAAHARDAIENQKKVA